MTNNEFLKDLYERHPWAFIPEGGTWGGSTFYPSSIEHAQRLRPFVPEHCEPVPDEAYAYGPDKPGAVFVQGPLRKPSRLLRFAGWAHIEGCWFYQKDWIGDCWPTLINLSDPNAHKIIELNRPTDDLLCDRCGGDHSGRCPPKKQETKMPFEKIELPGIEIDTADPAIYQALRDAGWTPPGDSEWLRLSECRLAIRGHNGDWFGREWDHAVLHALKHSPATVRVRKKQ